jgi:hypothetical protein
MLPKVSWLMLPTNSESSIAIVAAESAALVSPLTQWFASHQFLPGHPISTG